MYAQFHIFDEIDLLFPFSFYPAARGASPPDSVPRGRVRAGNTRRSTIMGQSDSMREAPRLVGSRVELQRVATRRQVLSPNARAFSSLPSTAILVTA